MLIGDDKTGSSDGLRCFNFCGRVESSAGCAVLCFALLYKISVGNVFPSLHSR
jgi:hypothetical protein